MSSPVPYAPFLTQSGITAAQVENEHLKAQMEALEVFDVYRDLFEIDLTSPIPTINGCRLGATPLSPVKHLSRQ
jgi:hypothetical protein